MLARSLLVYAAMLESLLFVNAFAQPPLHAPAQAHAGDKPPREQAPAQINSAANQLEMGALDRFCQPPPEYPNDFGSYRSPLTFYDGRPVMSAEDWPARRREILDRWHAIMGPWPPLVQQPTIEYLETQRRDNFTQHHVRIQIAPDRFTDDAYLLKPDGSRPFPAVVVVYYDSQTGIGLGQSPLRDFAYQLARRGFVALSLGSAPFSCTP